MSYPADYKPTKVWTMEDNSEGTFAGINRPTAGATHEKVLPVGKHPLQLYSLGTPNGAKVTIMLEELLSMGHSGAEYDAWICRIHNGDQFSSGFVNISPNSKIPALVDYSAKIPQRVFESGAILLYLAEKFDEFIPKSKTERTECLSWLFWQMSSTPYLGGGFGHFYVYAPQKIKYAIDRFAMEAKRQLDVLDQRLAQTRFISGSTYSIADMAIWAWYGQLVLGRLYEAKTFLEVTSYKNVLAWAKNIDARPEVHRGRMVNRTSGNPSSQLLERHDASDFGLQAQELL